MQQEHGTKMKETLNTSQAPSKSKQLCK